MQHPLRDRDIKRPLSLPGWRQVNAELRLWFRENRESLQKAHQLALEIQANLEWLDPFFEGYVRSSYAHCTDPCCQTAKVYYDREDLLFLHALPASVPPAQTRAAEGDPCRYLTPGGCALPRCRRPYICTWFMCDLHYQCFMQESTLIQRKFLVCFESLRICRQRLSLLYDPQGGL